MPQEKKRRTSVVQAGIGTDKAYKAVISPLYMSSTFEIAGIDQRSTYEYSRTRNPTRDELVNAISTLEHGIGGCVTASGMAALTLIIHLLNPDDLIIAPFDCYGRSYRLLCALSEKGHFKLEFIDQYDPATVEEAFKAKPKMMLIESPSNPVMRTADIAHITKCAKACGTIVAVDNTFLSPMLQQPLKLGADIVFHSTTKFLNGHSDVVGGCVVTSDKDILTDLEFWANSLGLIGAPFDSYMTLRGMRTLELRIHRAQENAQIIAELLDQHDKVDTVYYPGLPAHPGHEVAKRQQDGFGAMLSFEIKGAKQNTIDFVDHLEIFRLAQSLGGTESLINHPASMTHVSMGEEARAKAGVTDQLLRLSVGVEHIDDLCDDLTQALNKTG
ncbi:MAG: O-succinylhomoserine (thiol)-lyase [Alphaproteobacteria bacterium]|nr:MAG: O-succinylhomoserine (thiol)-lyase [Alphaproteobacteria bacterium]